MSLLCEISKSDASATSVLARVLEPLRNGVMRLGISGLKGSSRSFLLSLLWREYPSTLLVVTPTLEEADDYYRELLFFAGDHESLRPDGEEQFSICIYPPDEEFPFTHAARHSDLTSRKLSVLHQLRVSEQPRIIIVPVAALLRKSIPRSVLQRYSMNLRVGDEIDREVFSAKLVQCGYLKVGIVEDRGDYSVRGGIVDVFPPGYSAPVRIELFGDIIESIRHFDLVSQKSCGERNNVWIVPVTEAIFEEENLGQISERIRNQSGQEMSSNEPLDGLIRDFSQFQVNAEIERYLPYLFPHLETLFDYLPAGSLIYLHHSEEVKREREILFQQAEECYSTGTDRDQLIPAINQFYLTAEKMDELMHTFPTIYGDEVSFSLPEEEVISLKTETNEDIRKELISFTSSQAMLSPLVDRMRAWQDEGFTIMMICHSRSEVDKLIELLEEYGVAAQLSKGDQVTRELLTSPSTPVRIQIAGFTKGFRFPLMGLIIITEEELFGEKKRRLAPPRVKRGYFVSDFSELKSGDVMVHIDHGLGIYRGLKRLEIGGESSDYLLLEYQKGDKLYLPVDRIKLVQKYLGTDDHIPQIDRLGGTAWKKRKGKVKSSIKVMAQELLDTYASRAVLNGFSFSPIDHYYREFEATFPYEETPDQLAAIEDVMRDMSGVKPMDRLICGDVGYGKTEVAVRSSFRAAMDGKQVALLVPTTVLAQQHFQTFAERLKPYPIDVEMLSRFRTGAEQKAILQKLKEGKIDIIIGTHRLIQQDVHFSNLGLVIIDEEQRFGVAHKERLKQMKKLVDVLTLTATPIPRTLYMSMVGMRDMSVINTPPEDRLAIKTTISRFDDSVIREAIVRELRRGGQVFFVHDRVRSIQAMARYIKNLVPEAKLSVAHGQMSEKELEQVMISFVTKESNLLLCTTIIESGLDFPSANTIVINRADRMGLSQLYQLRGRVGRSRFRAYCYLLIPGESVLSKEAQDRLKAIFEFSELGSSFRLATRDLEIRGAGNLLGTSQSGHIAAVGIDLYTQLMEETMKELKGEPVTPQIDPEVNLSVPAFIPEDYIGDVNQRLVLYKRLSSCMDDHSVEVIREELGDRFGPPPEMVSNLLSIITLKNTLRRFLITRLDYNGREITATFHEQAHGSLDTILNLIETDPKRFRLSPDLKLTIAYGGGEWRDVINEMSQLLHS